MELSDLYKADKENLDGKDPADFDALPSFRYSPNCYYDMTFKKAGADDAQTCDCCGQKASYYYTGNLYARENVDFLCPECIATGRAADKYDGEFVQHAETELGDQAKEDELFRRTPGYMSWQGEYWLTCCDDYCTYLGGVGLKELEALGIAGEVLDEYAERDRIDLEESFEPLERDGIIAGYLFRCAHCGKHRIWADMT